jgi:rhodanese-related sulfurtransferase
MAQPDSPTVEEITPQEFIVRRAAGKPMNLIDVREPWELKIAPVPSETEHIPMAELSARVTDLDPAVETVVICRSGGRSLQAAHFLARHGFRNVKNLTGGILAWSRDVDPSIQTY